MKKLRIEDLHVDSFVTSLESVRRGTVMAHATEGVDSCIIQCATMAGMATCAAPECTYDAGCTTGGDTPHTNGCTQVQQTCGAAGTCAPGATGCGSCVGQETCDLQYGCGGTTGGVAAC